eukprot:448108_1
MSPFVFLKAYLPNRKLTVFWIILVFLFSILSIMELQMMTTIDTKSDHIEFFERSRLIQQHQSSVRHIKQQPTSKQDLLNLVGLYNIQKELNKTISSLQPLQISPNSGYFSSEPLPKNENCQHQGKVFSLGIMKTGTTSMNAALKSLGYKCHGDSCIHVGNWDYLIDGVFLWQPEEVINLSLLKIPKLWERYISDSFSGLNFGDSPWCFMYPIFDIMYPNSKFILSKRKSEHAYINSYLKYLKGYKKGYAKQGLTDGMFTSLAIRRYHLHNKMVEEYFKNRQNDLLIVTIDEENPDMNMMAKLNQFLGCKGKRKFPKKNRAGTRGKKVKVNEKDLNWRNTFGINKGDNDYSIIPFLSRDKNHDLKVHLQRKDQFELNFKTFVVEDLQHAIESIL